MRPFRSSNKTCASPIWPSGEGRAVVVAVNKWDVEENKQEKLRELKESFDRLLPQLRGAPLITVSAKTGRGLERLRAAILRAHDIWNRRVPTAALNRWLTAMLEQQPAASPARPPHQAALHDPGKNAAAGLCRYVLASRQDAGQLYSLSGQRPA